MTIRIAIHHHTEYQYDRLVNLTPHLIRLRPAPHTRTPVHQYVLKVEPEPHFLNWQQDPFGNFAARVVFPDKTRKFSVTVGLVADLITVNPFDFFVEEYAEQVPFEYDAQLRRDLAPYLEVRESGAKLLAWLAEVPKKPQRTVEFLVALNSRLQQDIGYVVRMEPGVQTCEETLGLAKGSCRDSAWLLVQICRHLGLAARFVSGYLVQLAPDQKSLDGPSGTEQDFTDLHAWTEVYVPGAGWIGLDPTSAMFAGEGHIPLACTPDPVSAAPITGGSDKAEVEFHFENKVTRIREDARVTKPYDDEQWAAVLALGDAVEAELTEGDVRLTMGGEPTFVSIDDMDSDQWNTAALGEQKRERAGLLLRRLHERFAPGAVLTHEQGKWYPGEPLPRWALGCYWRRDGQPVWQDPTRLADPLVPGKADEAEARAFTHALARQLGLSTGTFLPGYEDGLYYLWKEGSLPANLDVLDNKLADPLERDRLRRVFEQGLDHVVGFALPIVWDTRQNNWRTGPWRLRRGHLFLLPGDSPMGLRLPLDALLWDEEEHEQEPLRDPFAPPDALPLDFGEVHARYQAGAVPPRPAADRHEQAPADAPAGAHVRTALCVEIRNGVLHVFMPPLENLRHWLDLVAGIEAAAKSLDTAVVLEGYSPPSDQRLVTLKVTPDPGVIEVNVHPASNWRDLVAQTETLYEEARQSRLGTEKFMLDGRHTGTGGGNHVTLGGVVPTDSPMLRRPQVLTSLLRFWQTHPSLSYLFSGLFVGPTSQAPRADEARDDAMYELEIALQQLPAGDLDSPWKIDRALRNLLVDVTGNTHRSEFCIDKLYSPDSATGRLGIVEFRGFEMPPHPRMSMVQMLLLRAMVAHFWKQPYDVAPQRWGTELHDRFMLPHHVWGDFCDVLDQLNRWGYGFKREWFEAFFNFRFPAYGTVQIDDLELELRFAIEPWNVLGEEVTGQGTARFVDSSVERVQVKVRGMTDTRHVVTCNGRRVPLRATGERGTFVAGVRYKAWNPPSGLHPNIPVHAPLVFDVVDTWCDKSLGGCVYHVAHPAGRNYETLPVNSYEAEARRLARFSHLGHTPGTVSAPAEEPNGDHPYTLDLRYRCDQ